MVEPLGPEPHATSRVTENRDGTFPQPLFRAERERTGKQHANSTAPPNPPATPPSPPPAPPSLPAGWRCVISRVKQASQLGVCAVETRTGKYGRTHLISDRSRARWPRGPSAAPTRPDPAQQPRATCTILAQTSGLC